MLKFFLLLVIIFLAMRLGVRLVMSLFRSGVFFLNGSRSDRKDSSSSRRSSREVDEAEYEVIESHLQDKERGVE